MKSLLRSTAIVSLVTLVLGTGCRSPNFPGPRVMHVPFTEEQLRHRITELEQVGHSPETAERKARAEFASKTWQVDHSQAWVAEKARAERSAARERMDKELARLP